MRRGRLLATCASADSSSGAKTLSQPGAVSVRDCFLSFLGEKNQRESADGDRKFFSEHAVAGLGCLPIFSFLAIC